MNSIKNSGKHPIDDLFRQKLSNLEIQPSSEAKEKFLASLNQKETSKKPFWYFSAAAALIIIGGFSWLFLNNNLNTNTKTVIAENTHKSTQQKALENNSPVIPTEKQTAIQRPMDVKKLNIPTLPVKNNKVEKRSTLDKQNEIIPKEFKNLTGLPETDELIQDKLTIALQTAENKKNVKDVDSASNDLFQKSVGETIIIVASEINDEEIYLPEINSDSPMTLAQAEEMGSAIIEEDRSFMAKVFTELKHLKHGEKASFNSIVASNDQSIINDEDGFIGYETKQFKQRLRWLKGKISNQ